MVTTEHKQETTCWKSNPLVSVAYGKGQGKQFTSVQFGLDQIRQKGLAVASIARDDPSTLPGDDPFPRARMHRESATAMRGKLGSEFKI